MIDLSAVHYSIPGITKQKGESLFVSGAVKNLHQHANKIVAEVQGSYLYRVQITHNDQSNTLDCDCTCPAAERFAICKHAVAVVLAYEEKAGAVNDQDYEQEIQMVREHLTELKQEELVERLLTFIQGDEKQWKALITKLQLKAGNVSINEIRSKIHDALPVVEQYYDYMEGGDYFEDAYTQLIPIWEHLPLFSLEEQWDLLQLIKDNMDDAVPNFHYGDEDGRIATKLREQMPKVFQELAWTHQEKIDWLMEYAVLDNDDWFGMSDDFIAPFKDDPLLIQRCREKLANISEKSNKWDYSNCARIVLAQAKDWREVLVVKEQMASCCRDYLEICGIYLAHNEPLDAEHYLAKIRKKFTSDYDKTECNRMDVKIRMHLGEKESAWQVANAIFNQSPSHHEYCKLVKIKAAYAIKDDELLARVELRLLDAAKNNSRFAGELFEIYTDEKCFEKGVALLSQYNIETRLQLAFFELAFAQYPEKAMGAYLNAAAEQVSHTSNNAYQIAMSYLVTIEAKLQAYPEQLALFYQQAQALAKQNKAKRNFIKLFNEKFTDKCIL